MSTRIINVCDSCHTESLAVMLPCQVGNNGFDVCYECVKEWFEDSKINIPDYGPLHKGITDWLDKNEKSDPSLISGVSTRSYKEKR